MINKNINFYTDRIVHAFLENKLIAPIPKKYTKKLEAANDFRKICESKVKRPILGYKAGGTGLPLLRKFREKEPFYAAVYKHNICKNNSLVKKNKFTLGIELEVCYLIKKNFFNLKKKVTKKDLNKLISRIGPCIEVVGYRQKKKGIKSFGDLCSDFGGNIKFVLGRLKKYSKNNVKSLNTKISNIKIKQSVNGNTNTVYSNPMNALLFVLRKLQKEKVYNSKNFYVFTGSTVGVVPILGNGTYIGKIEKLGSVKARIN